VTDGIRTRNTQLHKLVHYRCATVTNMQIIHYLLYRIIRVSEQAAPDIIRCILECSDRIIDAECSILIDIKR
jgi:hypothetical protein